MLKYPFNWSTVYSILWLLEGHSCVAARENLNYFVAAGPLWLGLGKRLLSGHLYFQFAALMLKLWLFHHYLLGRFFNHILIGLPAYEDHTKAAALGHIVDINSCFCISRIMATCFFLTAKKAFFFADLNGWFGYILLSNPYWGQFPIWLGCFWVVHDMCAHYESSNIEWVTLW